MIDDRNDLQELERLFAAANPVAVDDLPDSRSASAEELYQRTLARARGTRTVSRRRTAHPRRAVLAVAVAIALLLVGGVAVAAVTGIPWWEEGEPPANPEVVDRQLVPHEGGFPPAADRARARTVARANGAALVAAPVGNSGYCLIPSLPGTPDVGFSCIYQVKNAASGASDDLRSFARPAADGEPRWIVYGRITDPRARFVDLSEAAGVPLKIPLETGGFFLADIPEERWSALANAAGRGRILDAAGETLRTGCVNWGPPPSSRGAGGACRAVPAPERPTPLFGEAEKLVEMTLRGKWSVWQPGTKIALWRAPIREGGECIYVAAATPRGGRVVGRPGMPGGGQCRLGPASQAPPGQSAAAGLSWERNGPGRYGVFLQGQFDAAERVSRVVLRTPAGEREIASGNGFYLAELPNAGATGELPPGGPYTVVAYDAAGREVATYELKTPQEQFGAPGG
jgi:hypothetical protein